MKTLRIAILFFCASILLLFSCSKDSSSNLEVGTARVTINGKGYNMNTENIEYEKNGDTLYFSIDAVTPDSTNIVNISFYNVVNVDTGRYSAVLNKRLDSSSVSLSYTFKTATDSGFFWCDGKLHFGHVTITYINNYNIECSFEFDALEMNDTSKTVKVKGTLSASFLGSGNPQKIKDVPIRRGTMVADLEGVPTELQAQAGTVTKGIVKETIISGNIINTGQSITLECVDFTPKINGVYTIGEKINGTGYFKASYAKDEKNIFVADGFNSSLGVLKIVKITPTSIQGTFDFTGYNNSNPTQLNAVKNGVFYATLTSYD